MLTKAFQNPPKGYGIVPFYWWMGDPLTKERIRWQLDRLKDHSITGLQINYAHGFEGGISFGLTYKSSPELFTEAWWALFQWFLGEGKKDGFSVSLSDYTLGSPGQGWYADEIRRKFPHMKGMTLEAEIVDCAKRETFHDINDESILYRGKIIGNTVVTADCGEQSDRLIIIIKKQAHAYSLDPMHDGLGKAVCETFFGRFEQHCPHEGGKGLNFFFSDELNFGVSGNLWNDAFAGEFMRRKGYDIIPRLPDLFLETDVDFVKTRLDYYDVIVQLEEENYFRPVYNWHKERGMVYGCDHGGRGHDVVEFGDYFRTQKYNQGPGCDQPQLQSDIIKNKVASSIAHCYGRKRVWLEGFYGSGWGTTSSQLSDAIARNFVMGQNLLSLHGLYYSTYGGWWEWAPPCNCFRMPYWDDLKYLLKAVERMSYLFSQGVHHCDCAIIYPVAAMEGGIKGQEAVRTAFNTGEKLYQNGIDFDFVDFESICSAEIDNGKLLIAGEEYQMVIIPNMKTVRFHMMEKLLAFYHAGGVVLCIGEPPLYSDAEDRQKLHCITKVLFQNQENLLSMDEDIVKAVQNRIAPDFYTDYTESHVYVNHRIINGIHLFIVYGVPKGTKCYFKAEGQAALLNPYDGKAYSIDNVQYEDGGCYLHLPLESTDFQILQFSQCGVAVEQSIQEIVFEFNQVLHTIPLSHTWRFALMPCLDNRFGDFRLPPSDEMIGPEIRTMLYCESDSDSVPATNIFQKNSMCSYGPYFLQAGPFHHKGEMELAIKQALNGNLSAFKEYEFSMRYGVWNDPGKQGYHGLKGLVSDEFLTIGERKETLTGTEYTFGAKGTGSVFYTTIDCPMETDAYLLTGTIKPSKIYINGEWITAEHMRGPILMRKGWNTVIAAYEKAGRTYLLLSAKEQSSYVQNIPLSMRWYRNSDILPLDCYKGNHGKYGYYRFISPPGLEHMEIPTRRPCKAWVNGEMCPMERISDDILKTNVARITKECAEAVIQVEYGGGAYGGSVFDAPIKLRCGEGIIEADDWSLIDGLRSYSGGALYSQTVRIPQEDMGKRLVLQVDEVVSSASLLVNNQYAGTKIAPNWTFDISGFVKAGENDIALKVSNTLANHYEDIPTRYRGDARSGLIGGARIIVFEA